MCQGEKITGVIAAHSPHKFAWYHGDPHGYNDLLAGKKAGAAGSFGGMVEIRIEKGGIPGRKHLFLRKMPGAIALITDIIFLILFESV